MMRLKNISKNTILGIIVAALTMVIINLQTTWLYYAIQDYGLIISEKRITRIGGALSILAFIAIVAIFKYKLKAITDKIILGSIIGIVISLFISLQGSWLYWAIKEQGVNFNPILFQVGVTLIVIIVFISSVGIFNNKRFEKVNINKISIYLLIAILISLIASVGLVMMILINVVNNFYVEESINIFKINLFGNALMIGGIGIFIIIFLTLVNTKVKYIKFLTKEVKRIKQEGFGKTIEVRGKDELAELCHSINEMSRELKEKIDNERKLEINKNELINNVSHDLRTPLTSIMGYIDLIKKGEYKDKAQFNEYVNIIDEKSKNLNKLINELFEYTKLNTHDIILNYSEVDLIALIEQVIGENIYIFQKNGLDIEKNIYVNEVILTLDIEKIVRVLDNLLSNALKYSIKESKVILEIKEDKDYVFISISNKTNKIEERDIQNIFERFYKVDKSRKDSESSGLGLSIVKRIIELHNGMTYVELKGDTISFTIKLPLR